MTHIEAMKLALEALESWQKTCLDCGRGSDELGRATKPITDLRQAIQDAEQAQPVACIGTNGELMWIEKPAAIYSKPQPLYTTPPQRKPLTDEEIEDLYFDKFSISELKAFARAIEAAHGIK